MKKNILVGLIVVILIIIAIPVISGFNSSFNPGGAIQNAQQQTGETSKLFIPRGYTLDEFKSQAIVQGNTMYTTTLTNGVSEITITQRPNQKIKCVGAQKSFGSVQTCYEEYPKAGMPTLKRISWDKNDMLYAITVVDDGVASTDLEQLIESIE